MDDRRKTRRFALGLQCIIRSRGGVARRANLIDISQSGCRVEVASPMHAHDLVWLSIGPIRGVCGTVTWSSPDFVGVEFADSLHEYVVDQLVAAAGPLSDPQQVLMGLAYRSERLAHWSSSRHDADYLFALAADCRANSSPNAS